MSSYCSLSDINTLLDSNQLISCTDDFQTGTINTTILNNIISMASNKVDAMISSIYAPFTGNVPAKVKDATIVFCAYVLMQRRLLPNEINPYKSQADYWTDTLTKINAGQLSLDEQFNRGFTPVVYSSICNRVNSNIF